METIFFLKFYAYMFFIIGLAMVISKSSREAMLDLEKNNSFLLGIISLLIGLPVIILHNIWQGFWEITITIFGWSAVIKGFLRMLNNSSFTKKRVKNLSIMGGLLGPLMMLIFGCILMYVAYFLYSFN